MRVSKACSALSHLISSSSVGAHTTYVRLGVMILKQFSFLRLAWPSAPPTPLPRPPGVAGALGGPAAPEEGEVRFSVASAGSVPAETEGVEGDS